MQPRKYLQNHAMQLHAALGNSISFLSKSAHFNSAHSKQLTRGDPFDMANLEHISRSTQFAAVESPKKGDTGRTTRPTSISLLARLESRANGRHSLQVQEETHHACFPHQAVPSAVAPNRRLHAITGMISFRVHKLVHKLPLGRRTTAVSDGVLRRYRG